MPQQITLGCLDDFPIGEGREITAEGRIFAVFRLDEDQFQVIDGICPHAGGPLAKGHLQDNIVTCPWHGWQFDVQTGQHCLTPQIRNSCFPASIDENQLKIELPTE